MKEKGLNYYLQLTMLKKGQWKLPVSAVKDLAKKMLQVLSAIGK